MTYELSPQQAAFLAWVQTGHGSANLRAVAGAGKTTTLLEAAALMDGSVALVAYNKAIATELQDRLAQKGLDTKRIRAGTFHSFGFSAVRRWAPDVRMDGKKMNLLAGPLHLNIPEAFVPFALAAASLAKQRAFGVLTPIDSTESWLQMAEFFELTALLGEVVSNEDSVLEVGVEYAQKLLRKSNDVARSIIDFDDMIYVPLMANLKVWQNDWVLVDEAQDTNPARRALAKRMLRPGGRFIAVGDPYQAIYGFTGADNDAFGLLAEEFGCQEFPLTVTFRCPKAVTRLAQQWVPDILAAPSAPEGTTSSCDVKDLRDNVAGGDVVLCRNTKPLVELCYALIAAGTPATVEGRDIGAGLIALATKWRSAKTIQGLRARLSTYLETETARLLAKGREVQAGNLNDRVETLYVIMAALPDDAKVTELRSRITAIFDDTKPGVNRVVLSTIHRSKGREWDRVWLLGRDRFMPSPFARQQWQMDQERNLMYVAVTRAKSDLIDVVVPNLPSKRN